MEDVLQDSVQLTAVDSVMSDSIQVIAEIKQEPVVSLFEEHQLEVQNDFNYLEKPDLGNGFAFVILFICAMIVIYLQRNSDNIFADVVKSSFDQNQAQQDARVENSQRTRNLLILQLLGFISIALFIAGAALGFSEKSLSLQNVFFIVLAGLIGFVLSKKLILWSLAQVFDLRQELKLHHFNLNILQSVAGLVLLPLALLLFYSPQIPNLLVVYIGLATGTFFYLKGLQRGISVAVNSPALSTLHLFYYFCALEILPAFVLIRIVQSL